MNRITGTMVLALLALGGCQTQGAPALRRPDEGRTRSTPLADPRCTSEEERGYVPQGTELWGIAGAGERGPASAFRSVLRAAKLGSRESTLGFYGPDRTVLGTTDGAPEALRGATLTGVRQDGTKVELALCDVTRRPYQHSGRPVTRYDLRYYDGDRQAWRPVCARTDLHEPLALALPGVWDEGGMHHDSDTSFTLSCESGILGKCVGWGYLPTATTPDGHSLKDMHQACVYMARADYCGNGHTHTREATTIDIYDIFKIEVPEGDSGIAPLSFEAAWGPEGAVCLRRTRYNEPIEDVLRDCPGTFATGTLDLGNGDRCTYRRRASRGPGEALLRNRSMESNQPAMLIKK